MSVSDYQPKQIINESLSSHKDDVYKKTQASVKESIDQNMKVFSSQLLNTINSSLQMLNTDYEKTLEKNKETHENFCSRVKEDIKASKGIYEKNIDALSSLKTNLNYNLINLRNAKAKNKMFNALKQHSIKSKTLKYEENIVAYNYFKKKKLLNIIKNWKNITHANLKTEVNAKYSKYFNEEQEKCEKTYKDEIDKLMKVLQQIEGSIKKEIDERRYLSKLYDIQMNKGANQFLQETQVFKDFNSSDVQAP